MVSMPDWDLVGVHLGFTEEMTMVSMPRPPSRRHVSSAWHWFAIQSQIGGDQVN